MFQAHIVHAENRHLYSREFDEFLKQRHKYFAEKKKWVPISLDGRERDQFDTDAATYILGMENGRVVTSCRLIPTSEPHLVSEAFPDFCERAGVPRRPDWAESTRTFVDSRQRGLSRKGTLMKICCAVMEYAVREGIQAFGGVQEVYFMPLFKYLRWPIVPLGASRDVNGETYTVLYVEVSPQALDNVRQIVGVRDSILVERGPSRRFVRPDAPLPENALIFEKLLRGANAGSPVTG